MFWYGMSAPTPSISIITATPPGYNPGMLAVELAAQDFLRRHGLLSDSKFFRLMALETRLRHASAGEMQIATELTDIGIDFETLSSVEQIVGSIPVFWGDFHHMAQYIKAMGRAFVSAGKFSGYAAAEAYLMGILLLADAPQELLHRTISFGSTLLFNNMNDSLQGSYWPAFERFSSSIALFKVRDVFSANYLRGLRSTTSPYPLGPDAAQLLNRSRIKAIQDSRRADSNTQNESPSALFFLGRGNHNVQAVRKTLQHLESRLSCRFHWLPWGDKFAFPLLHSLQELASEFPSAHELTPIPFFELLNLVQEASVIVTDTYHLAVIGWSFGVPVICMTGYPQNDQVSVNAGNIFAQRDKRFVFYAQNELLDFFLDAHVASNPATLNAWADWVCEFIRANQYVPRHLERAHNSVLASEEEVANTMHALRGDS